MRPYYHCSFGRCGSESPLKGQATSDDRTSTTDVVQLTDDVQFIVVHSRQRLHPSRCRSLPTSGADIAAAARVAVVLGTYTRTRTLTSSLFRYQIARTVNSVKPSPKSLYLQG